MRHLRISIQNDWVVFGKRMGLDARITLKLFDFDA
jgi:hypothetical protein